MPGLLIAAVVVLIILIAVVSHLLAAQRRKDLMVWAAARGFCFSAERESFFDDRYGRFPCLARGENRYAFNIMRGRHNEYDIIAFDYHYETYTHSKNGRQTHHHYFSAAIIPTDIPLKPLLIRPEGLFDKLTELVGFEDIDFESAEFSRAFYVSASDRKWAFDVIQQTTMEFLLGAPKFTLEFAGHEVIIYRNNKFTPDDFDASINVVEGVLERLPQSVKSPQETMLDITTART